VCVFVCVRASATVSGLRGIELIEEWKKDREREREGGREGGT